MATGWEIINEGGNSVPQDTTKAFKITAPPNTDVWRPNPSKDTFTAPFAYTTIRTSQFKRVSVTVSASWKTQYDQGGLMIVFPQESQPSKWMKTGIEYFNGKPSLSVVGCDRFSDWSLSPMPSGGNKATFEAVRDGETLWIYSVNGDDRWPLREIKWAFIEDRVSDAEMWIGVCAAKPTSDKDDAQAGVEVTFQDLQIDLV